MGRGERRDRDFVTVGCRQCCYPLNWQDFATHGSIRVWLDIPGPLHILAQIVRSGFREGQPDELLKRVRGGSGSFMAIRSGHL
jgi:hypothetical protein